MNLKETSGEIIEKLYNIKETSVGITEKFKSKPLEDLLNYLHFFKYKHSHF